MVFSHSLPEKADIYIKSKRSFFRATHYKPLVLLKVCSIVIFGSLTLFMGAIILTPPQTPTAISAAETVNHDNHDNDDRRSPSPSPFIIRIRPVIRTSAIVVNTNKIRIKPFQSTATSSFQSFPNLAMATLPEITPMPIDNTMMTTDTNSGTSTQMPQDIAGISSQLVAIQQQIGSQMQSCVTNAQQMANQIIQLQNEQKQLQTEIDSLNNQSSNIDTSTTSGQRQSDALNNQIQQLQSQSDNLGNNISTAQDNFNNANSQCQQNVSNLEDQRGTLEGNLDDAFSNAMNIQFPQ